MAGAAQHGREVVIGAPSATDRATDTHYLAGIFWHCTGYDKIVRAVLEAAKGMQQAQVSV